MAADEAALLAAFPDDYSSGNISVKRRYYTGDGPSNSAEVEFLARKIFKKAHSWLGRTSTRVVNYKSLSMGINFRADMMVGANMMNGIWRYMHLGTFDRDELQGENGLEQIMLRLDDIFVEMGEHYPGSLYMHTFILKMTGLEWQMRGGCKSKRARIIDDRTGMVLQQFKVKKAGQCGPVSVIGALKKMGKVVDPELMANINTPKRAEDYMSLHHGIVFTPGLLWTPTMLYQLCQHVNVNLVVYDRFKLDGRPMYGVEGTPSVGTVRLSFSDSRDIMVPEGEDGHYLLIQDTNKTCSKCKETYSTKGKKKHMCKTRCKRIIDEKTGKVLQQFNVWEDGQCGPVSVIGALKKMGKVVDPKLMVDINTVKRAENYMALHHGCVFTPNFHWSFDMLSLLCQSVDVNLVVYDRFNLNGPPLYGVEGTPSAGTVRLSFTDNSVLPEGEHGRYHMILDLKRKCPKCEETYSTKGKKKHMCKWTCTYCSQTLSGSRSRHKCKEQIKQTIEKLELYESAYLTNDRKRVRKEVDDIVEGKVDDSETVAQWRQSVDSGAMTCLLGDAGTGKTHTISSYLREKCESGEIIGKQVCIASAEAVGVSAYRKHLEGLDIDIKTIHSTVGLRVGQKWQKRAIAIRDIPYNKKIKERINAYDILVVDEIGSCSPSLFNSLDGMLRIIRECNTPFGGLKVVFIGDFRQRSSFSSKSTIPIFMNDSWSKLEIKYFTLRQQHRVQNMSNQDEINFLRIQMYIARGVACNADLDWLNSKCYDAEKKGAFMSEINADETRLVMMNKQVYKHGHLVIENTYPPEEIRSFDIEVSEEGEECKAPDFTPNMRRCFDEQLKVAVGCPVMFTDNSCIKQAGNPCNGMVGRVVEIEDDCLVVRLDDDNLINVHRIVLPGQRAKKEGYQIYKQFPVRLAYARTIHKTQGVTLNKVALFMNQTRSFAKAKSTDVALAYVAISRVRSVKDLRFNRPIRSRDIVVCKRSVIFMDLIRELPYEVVYNSICKKTTHCFNFYAFNLETTDNYVSVSDNSVCERKLKMYTREKYRTLTNNQKKYVYKGNFHRILYFDLETTPAGDNRKQTCDFVVARYWEDYEVKKELRYGVKPGGGLEKDVMEKMVTMLMDDIVKEDVRKWAESGFKRNKSPIRVVAYNGSNFDFSFVLSWMIANSRWEGLTYKPLHKNSTIIQCNIDYYSEEYNESKSIIRFWDPCLITMGPLDGCHKDYCPEKHASMKKDCFPFNYLAREGAEVGYAKNEEVEMNIKEDFPYKSWDRVYERIKEGVDAREKIAKGLLHPDDFPKGTLEAGSKEGTVMFNCVAELLDYCEKDVIMMEDLVESLSMSVWNDVFPESNIPVFSYVSAASLGFSALVFHLDEKYKLPVDPECKKKKVRSKLHKLNAKLTTRVRRSVYGGRTLPRALIFISSKYDELKRKEKAGTLGPQDYLDLEDCLLYIDKVGMYHGIMKDCEFPYDKETVLDKQADVDLFWEQYLKRREDDDLKDFPMFIAEFEKVVPNKYDVESALPGRTVQTGKRLIWDNLDKHNAVYNSVHVDLGLRRGYRFEKPNHIILWGKLADEHSQRWVGTKGKLFYNSSKKWEEFRMEGGAKKNTGKGISNSSFGGCLKRDFHSEVQFYIAEPGEGVCPTYEAYKERLASSEWTLKYETTYVRKDGGAVKMVEWEQEVDGEDYICSRPSYIGSFILAYAHRDIDDSLELMLGDNRRNGSMLHQAINGDTDSIMIHWKHVLAGIKATAKKEAVNNPVIEEKEDEGDDPPRSFEEIVKDLTDANKKRNESMEDDSPPPCLSDIAMLKFDNFELGTFNDDLKKLYRKGTDPIQYVEKDGVMMPQFAKIIRQANPGKKLYAMDVLLPSGKIVTVDTKKKGIPKGAQLAILNGEERKEMLDEELGVEVVADTPREEKRRKAKRKRDEKVVLEERLSKMPHTGELSAKYFYDSIEKKSSITARSGSMKKRGFKVSPDALRKGIRPYEINCVYTTKQILKNGAAFPPERVKYCKQEDPTVIMSVPRGWVSKTDPCAHDTCEHFPAPVVVHMEDDEEKTYEEDQNLSLFRSSVMQQ